MWSTIANIFTGGLTKSIENIATEWITTPKEEADGKYRSAEAKALFIKTLDPNGLMRRDISNKISNMYVVYIMMVMILVLAQSFGIGDAGGVKTAIESLTSLFIPITTMFTAIVGASFGVNISNNIKDKGFKND